MRSAKAMTSAINLRVSTDERVLIERGAREAGMLLSDFIRTSTIREANRLQSKARIVGKEARG